MSISAACSTQDSCLLSIAMAHLPRWIVSDKCDSQAMYSAFLAFFNTCEDQGVRAKLRCLTFIYHRGPDPGYEDAHGDSVTLLRCRKRGCIRCREARGGYAFRWYDQRWYAKYLWLKRPSSWTLRSEERLLNCSFDSFFLYSDDPQDGSLQAVPDDEPLCQCSCGCWKPLRYLAPALVEKDCCFECWGDNCGCSCIGCERGRLRVERLGRLCAAASASGDSSSQEQ